MSGGICAGQCVLSTRPAHSAPVTQSRHPTRPCWVFCQCAWSFHIAVGPLVFTEAAPPSRADSLEWSSLASIARPFEALRLSIG